MQTSADQYLLQVNKSNGIRVKARKALPFLSLMVTLCVFWCLKLTGITMAGEAFCGMPEHVHGEECPIQTLICGLEESEAHMHTEDCILRQLICPEEETDPHSHSADCLEKNLACPLAETEGHTHGTECESRRLICELEEIPSHSHEDECSQYELICTTPESGPHHHGDFCYTQELVCGQEESETHAHGAECITNTLCCGQTETDGHSHGADCYNVHLICTQEETDGHSHCPDCYVTESGYICGLEEAEPHFHEDVCYETLADSYICGLEETEGHSHETACYEFGIGFGCGLTEAEGHLHLPECITPETQFCCEKEISEGHTHADSCYDILETCPLEEHIHDETCYSDLTADLETSDDWEMSLAGLTRSTSTAENIIIVARAQLGCTESIRNFEVDENGIRRGITRFGQWYGNPYGDWSAMFASFCLYYAGVDEVPMNAGVESMRLEWDQAGLYISAAEYAPVSGHLLFLDKDLSGTAEAVAIIAGFENNLVSVIEGDLDNAVAETDYSIEDPAIMGYGMVPFEEELVLLPLEGTTLIANTTAYDPDMFTDTSSFVLYVTSGSAYYAFDGNGNAVQISIDADGGIYSDVTNPDILLWTFDPSGGTNSYLIRNVQTGRYMHAFPNNGTGVTTSGAYSSQLIISGAGVKIKSNTEYARLDVGTKKFVMTQNQNLAATYQFGVFNQCSVWLDGTNGGMMSLGGSPNTHYNVLMGETMVLPDQWQSPDKYDYRLRGWYDVINNTYYPPGAEIVVTENMVFYADWAAQTYNIGQYNSRVADTVSTNDFVTTHVFDYGVLFNVLSSYADVDVSASGHTETWRIITSGNNRYNNESTLNYIFRDWDKGNEDISYPVGSTGSNTNGGVYSGLYSQRLHNLLFNPGQDVIGKQYLGTGDHLFQFMSDPDNTYYGYYYYDSKLNAASYNQSARRFYVYNYLECTRDSLSGGINSDFLPLNSPYANTNGKTVPTYSYAGENGEYNGVPHYLYDAKYNTSNNSTSNMGTNYFFGMSIDINFYLPNSPGTRHSDGTYGNLDLYGKEMHFKFSGDDDVWVLVDGKLVLDIGGIHGIESGDINFSSGVVTVNGSQTGSITSLEPGDHKLTILYLERGSSQSNCAIYFNLAPRFSFNIQKEDVLTQEVLNGAQFSVFTDKACTVPAELWVSKASHDRGDAPSNVFTVANGKANMWGMGAGNTYYIKETKPPDNAAYSYARGIISVSIDKRGLVTYKVELLEETNSDGTTTEVSGGFTVHGFRIDEQTQSAYIVATNAPSWVKETTSVTVRKEWADSEDHSGDLVTVYLTVTDPDGTVRQIRQVQLGTENNWRHTWDNLPKYYEDGVTKVQYGVTEAYSSGYYSKVEKDYLTTSNGFSWQAVSGLKDAETYILSTANGCLSTSSRWNHNLKWVDMATAKNSSFAKWTAEWIDEYSCYRFVNGSGAVLTLNESGQYYYATTSNVSAQCLAAQSAGSGIRIYAPTGSGTYFFQDMQSYGRASATTDAASGTVFTPYVWKEDLQIIETDDWLYKVVNTPLSQETALTVHKVWDYGFAVPGTEHEQAKVTIALLANGKDTGRTVTLTLNNSWTATFRGLPYVDSSGNTILYTVKEQWEDDAWIPYYGAVEASGDTTPVYTTVVTNVYRYGTGAELPSTGSAARLMYMLCGGGIMLTSLVYGIGLRRKRERGQK